MTKVPRLRITSVVTPRHGARFAEEICSGAGEAFDASGVVTWPASYGTRQTASQARYHEIENEIVERTLEAVKPQIAETFVRIAAEVLDRERGR